MNSQDQPLVSIIICFLNEENFLEEAVMSVLKQDYKNWELFLIGMMGGTVFGEK